MATKKCTSRKCGYPSGFMDVPLVISKQPFLPRRDLLTRQINQFHKLGYVSCPAGTINAPIGNSFSLYISRAKNVNYLFFLHRLKLTVVSIWSTPNLNLVQKTSNFDR